MRGILALLVVAYCLSNSDATLRHIKSKLNSLPILQSAIQYLAAPEPLPPNYARPGYSSHVSTFSVSVPSAAAGIGLPNQVQGGSFGINSVHPELLTVPPPQLSSGYHYPAPEVAVQPLAGQFVEQYYNSHFGSHQPLNNYQLGNW